MNPSAKFDEIVRLADLACDGTVDDEPDRLDELLRDDPASQQFYLRLIELDVALAWQGDDAIACGELAATASADLQGDEARSPSSNPQTTSPNSVLTTLGSIRVSSRQVWVSVVVVAVLFYGSFMLIAWNLRQERLAATSIPDESTTPPMMSASSPARSTDLVAVLTASRGCRWGKVDDDAEASHLANGPRTNDRLTAGQQLVLVAGTAEITFAGGAVVEIDAPANFELSAAGEGFLAKGRAMVRVPQRAVGFTVATPSATVVDLGTEFAVEIDDAGATDVFVLRGIVETIPNGASGNHTPMRLGQDQAARVEMGSDAVASVSKGDSPLAQTVARRDQLRRQHISRELPALKPAVALPISTILPGTEVVTLVPNGGFSSLGVVTPPGSGQHPFPEHWTRRNDMFVVNRLPQLALPALCQGWLAIAKIDARNADAVYQQDLELSADTEYMLSAYLWNFGNAEQHVLVNVDLSDANGEAQLYLAHDDIQAAEGLFVYHSFHTGVTAPYLTVRAFYDCPVFSDDAETSPIAAAWDNIAITRASEFKPPQTRVVETIPTTHSAPSQ